MSNIIELPKRREETVLISPKGAVKLAFFAAYQDKMPKALAIVEKALNMAEQRGFGLRDMLVRYAVNPKAEANGKRAFEIFLTFVSAMEFFELSGVKIVPEQGGSQ
jgi:hypothetical protein